MRREGEFIGRAMETMAEAPGLVGPGGRRRTRAARYRAGKALRHRVPRSLHAVWNPSRDRPDPVELLRAGDRLRVRRLLPIRYARMSASPFGFLRGAAAVMARDLIGTPVTGVRVQMVGDAHLSNFGLFATPERAQVFDANDFDETFVGPWEWDLKRLATSIVLVGRVDGLPRRAIRGAIRAAVRAYRERMHTFAGMRYLDVWYSHMDLAETRRALGRRAERLLGRELRAARQRTGFQAFPKLVRVAHGRARIRDASPLIRHYVNPREETLFREVFRRYPLTLPRERRTLLDRYRLEDVTQKVVGVGSVGTRCAVGLFLGDPDLTDPVFLQVKEALPSVYEAYLGPSPFSNHAERVVEGQRLVQEASDIFLGWSSSGGHDFYVRQLRDMKLSADISVMNPKSLVGQAQLCGAALARAHARTGDPTPIAGYLGTGDAFDEAIVRFGEAYARQTGIDHASLLRAIAKGLLPAGPDE